MHDHAFQVTHSCKERIAAHSSHGHANSKGKEKSRHHAHGWFHVNFEVGAQGAFFHIRRSDHTLPCQ